MLRPFASRALRARIPIMSLALLLGSCLEAQDPKSTEASPERPIPVPEPLPEVSLAQVTLNLNSLSLTQLPSSASEAKVQVYAVKLNRRAEPIGSQQNFALGDDKEFPLADLKPGLYDITVDIFGASGVKLGASDVRALLVAGAQSLPEWNWRLDLSSPSTPQPPAERKLELAFIFDFPALSEPAEVREVLKSSCVGCHSDARKRGKLSLESYPYKSDDPDTSALGLSGIAALNASRVADISAPMPPLPLKPLVPEKQEILKAFATRLEAYEQAQKQLENLLGDADITLSLSDKSLLKSQLKREGARYFLEPVISVATGKELLYSLVIRKPDGSLLIEQKNQVLKVPAQGGLTLQIPFPQ